MSRIEDLGAEPDNLLPEDEVAFLEKEHDFLELEKEIEYIVTATALEEKNTDDEY